MLGLLLFSIFMSERALASSNMKRVTTEKRNGETNGVRRASVYKPGLLTSYNFHLVKYKQLTF